MSSTKADGESTLRLIFWLLEKSNSGQRQFRLVDEKEAQSLLDRLEFSQIERHLDGMQLKPVRSLISSYHRTRSRPGDEEQPLVLDDSLAPRPEEAPTGGHSKGQATSVKPKNSFQMLMDRFSESSFVDNLHLYLILFILVLVLIILCVAVPMICCCRSSSSSSSSPDRRAAVGRIPVGRRRRTTRAPPHNIPIGSADDHNIATISGSKNLLLASGGGGDGDRDEHFDKAAKFQQQSDAIWRKLSNTTTTLIKDESSILVRNDGTTGTALSMGDRFERQPRPADDNQLFEWYPFHSGADAENPSSATNPRTHKSVQTNESRLLRQHQQEAAETRPMTLHSRSDTMSKSELVMLKEKMIPIMQERRQQVSTQTSQEATAAAPVGSHDYVNQSQIVRSSPPASSSSTSNADSQAKRPAQLEDCISSMPSRHIDSSDSRSIGLDHQHRQRQHRGQPQPLDEQQQQRQPSMRRLELPAKTRSKVDAIKSELEKLEQRDPVSTYKRYDVI